MNHPKVSSNKLEELTNMDFLDQKNQKLKQDIVNHLLERSNQNDTNFTVSNKFKTIIEEINELSGLTTDGIDAIAALSIG